jgi:hypothetical protein
MAFGDCSANHSALGVVPMTLTHVLIFLLQAIIKLLER